MQRPKMSTSLFETCWPLEKYAKGRVEIEFFGGSFSKDISCTYIVCMGLEVKFLNFSSM
jgi:hypothetical protein